MKSYRMNEFAKDVRDISRANGFDNPSSIDETEKTCTKLILIIDEVCEALHEVRKTASTQTRRTGLRKCR